jgi:hypothetical protein
MPNEPDETRMPDLVAEAYGTVTPPPDHPEEGAPKMASRRKANALIKYRVEIDGETVWSGEGDHDLAIPAEYLARPDDTAPDEPHPSPHYLYAQEPGGEEVLIGVQVAETDELEQVIAHEAEALEQVRL